MTAAGFAAALRILCSQKPFRPFRIELSAGQVLSIHHPEAIALRGEVWIFVTPQRDYHFLDFDSVSQLVHSRPKA